MNTQISWLNLFASLSVTLYCFHFPYNKDRSFKEGSTLFLIINHLNLYPSHRWYRQEGLSLRQVLPNPRIKYHLEVLILHDLKVDDSGIYVCIVNNTLGSMRLEVNLTVRSPLGVRVDPVSQMVDMGNQAFFTCSIVGWPVKEFAWFKNGSPLMLSSNR